MIELLTPSPVCFGTVSLEELDRRAPLLERAENKYVARFRDPSELQGVLESLTNDFDLLTISDRGIFNYESIYFDCERLASYKQHVQGKRKRFKVRSRCYVDSNLYYFEVKLKGIRGRTIKKRMPYDCALYGQVSADAMSFVRRCFRDIYGQEFVHQLRPTLKMRYKRMTLVGKRHPERVTLDFDLVYLGTDDPAQRVTADCTIIEVKSERGTGLADRVMRGNGLRGANCSKYCVGLNLIRHGLQYNRFKPVLRTYFGWSRPRAESGTMASREPLSVGGPAVLGRSGRHPRAHVGTI